MKVVRKEVLLFSHWGTFLIKYLFTLPFQAFRIHYEQKRHPISDAFFCLLNSLYLFQIEHLQCDCLTSVRQIVDQNSGRAQLIF